MEMTPFDLTLEQKSLLIALAQETGKPIPALIAKALEELEEHVHARPGVPTVAGNGGQTGLPGDHERSPRRKRLGEMAADLLQDVPEEDFACLGMAPNSMTITSMAHPNIPHEALFCRYVLLDCPLQRQGPVARVGHGLR